ncbi:MAG: ADOP family duplicated permease [Edaphobacter sp.]|uniref:ADOP family duplicated permease n=1 Tax=Edaphobacter sp. TaxID=1934404 RepID=UPI00239ACC54|nr:ADOP family duplicated permease [Edaphobacter sp.]MDE1178758.1 ADOP family duplicated permease [Edaphobacter sp.]
MDNDLLYRLRVLFRRQRVERELDEELMFHVEHEAEKLKRSGLSPEEALRQARIALGGATQVQQQVRDGRGVRLWDEILADARFAFRQLRRSPVFTVTALATLTLSIGAAITMMSLANSVLREPLAYPEPDRLVGVSFTAGTQSPNNEQTGGTAQFLLQNARSFQSTAIYSSGTSGANLATGSRAGDGAVQVAVQSVDRNFFPTLGVQPVLGRNFSADEDRRTGPKAILLSYGVWQRMFNSSPDVLDRVIQLNGESVTIAGVMPQGLNFGTDDPRSLSPAADAWQPLKLDKSDPGYAGTNYNMIARLRDGVTLVQAGQEMESFNQQLYKLFPYLKLWITVAQHMPELRVWPLQTVMVSNVRTSLLTLTSAVCAVLLVACLNLAGLMAARASRRQREISLRTALGASRANVLRLLISESLLLALTGAALGVLCARVMQPLLLKSSPIILPHTSTSSLLLQIGLALPLALAVTLLCGLLPSWLMLRRNSSSSLQVGHTVGASSTDVRLGKALLVMQTAVTVLLLSAASLLLGVFLRLRATPLGVQPQHLTVAQVNLKGQDYSSTAATMQFVDKVLARLREYPGVRYAAAINGFPLDRGLNVMMEPAGKDKKSFIVEARFVTPDYFRTMGIPMLAGRDFTDSDNEGAPIVAVMSEALVKKLELGSNPVGQQPRGIWGSDKTTPTTVIGVVADARTHSLAEDPALLLYVPFTQQTDKTTKTMNGWFRTSFAIRSAADTDLAAAVQQAIHEADPGIPVSRYTTMQAMIDNSLARPRFLSTLVMAFAVFALVLTVIGLFGLLSYQVTERTREIGVRMALGASRGQIVSFIMRRGVLLTLAGLAVGSATSLLLPRLVRALMSDNIWTAGVGVKGSNMPGTTASVAAACAAMLLAAAVASFLPARKASAIEPLEALRTE